MKSSKFDKKLDKLIYNSISRTELKFDFNKWKLDHQKEIEEFRSQVQNRRIKRISGFSIWSKIMQSKITKMATAAVIILAMSLTFIFFANTKTAYALTETVNAWNNVRNIHTVTLDNQGEMVNEKWIEIDTNGYQTRFRQESSDLLIIDDGETVFVYYKDKSTVIRYDISQKHYQWISNLGKLFKELAGKGEPGTIEVEKNVVYKNTFAHRVNLISLNIACYIDTETKLPLAVGNNEISYEKLPPDIFTFTIPEGTYVVDKRPGAKTAEEPSWMKDDEFANSYFKKARQALVEGDYPEAVELFTQVVDIQPSNWAIFWLGKAQYCLYQDDIAIEEFTKVIQMLENIGQEVPYAYLARGIAYASKGMEKESKKDLQIALPIMIKALRNPQAAIMFDYADYPLYGDRNARQRELIDQASTFNMIHRLRKITGQKFGMDLFPEATVPDEVIVAWENWYHSSGEIQVDVDYILDIYIPEVPVFEKEFRDKVYSLITEKTGNASELFQECQQLQPSDHIIWSILGLGLYEEEHYLEALESLRHAEQLEEKQDSEHIYGSITWQGHILDLLGRRDEALECYNRALKQYSRSSFYVEYGQYGIKVDDKWIQQRLQEPFQRKKD